MTDDREPALTRGVHHVGLTVGDPEASAAFFVEQLAWRVVRRDPGYPAVFVSDGSTMLTLWALKEDTAAAAFDRRRHVGLHHLALAVGGAADLEAVYQRLRTAPGVVIEFAPEPLRQGPARHMMCSEPGGIRIEFIWPG